MNKQQHNSALIEAVEAATKAGHTVCLAPDAFGGVTVYLAASNGNHHHAGSVVGYWPQDASRWIFGEVDRLSKSVDRFQADGYWLKAVDG